MNWLWFIHEEPIIIRLGSWITLGDLQIDYSIILDSLSMSVMVPVGIVTICVLWYAIEYMSHDPNINRFLIILSIFAVFMSVLVVSDNYLMMFIGWEFVGVISYLLISFWSTRIDAMKSALSAILLNRLGDTFFIIAMAIMLNTFYTLNFYAIELLVPNIQIFILNIIATLLFLAACAKSAQFGFHSWLLLAMEGCVKALFKFHYIKEYPFIIWSNKYIYYIYPIWVHILLVKSKLYIFKYKGQSLRNMISKRYYRSLETLCEIIFYNPFKYYTHLLYIPSLVYGEHSLNNKLSSSKDNNLLYESYNIYPPGDILDENYNQKDFYYWLIGFTEGDGSFIINNYNNYLEFKITQSSADIQVLYYIKKNLGFGKVSIQDKNRKTHCYRVRDKEGLLKIINIFNGNLHLNKYNNKFKLFVDRFNETYKTNIKVINKKNKINLDNAWLVGFTDAEGCFTHSYINNNISIRYILSQKNEDNIMQELAILLGGYTYKLNKCNTMNMTVNYLKLIKIIKYLNHYKLITKKYITYKNWLWVYNNYKNKTFLNNEILLKNFIKKANKGK